MENRKIPLVSVLIAAYNVEKYIESAVNAVSNQTYKNIEIIIVNDGSTDNTGNLLNTLAQKDNRIKIINNHTNLGFVASLNKGIKEVNGVYIARTDADDIAKPHWIETIVNYMEKNLDIMAMGSYLTILSEDHNGSILSKVFKNGELWKNPLNHEDIVQAMLFYNPMHNNTMIMKRSIFTEYGLTFDHNYKHAEDYKFWLDVSRIGKLANYPESLVYYRFHGNQTSSLHNEKQIHIANQIRRIAINYYFNDINLDFKLEENFSFEYAQKLHKKMTSLNIINKNINKQIIFDIYLSFKNYKPIDVIRFYRNNLYKTFSFKQNRKIIKKLFNINKYNKIG
ncbi:glycosyl transferase family 2 [Otariodibacter oris]|nr:glycosyltransferase family 2 protein [Otariodibacter oris]QGM81714.1 glycosyl transferase family 2 [Otariodibacter oris]